MSSLMTYHIIANSFTVADIADSIEVQVEADTKLTDVWERLAEVGPDHWFGLVRDGEEIVGYLSLDDDLSDTVGFNAGGWANSITPDQMVPASMPILEILPLFEKHYFFFVLDRNDIIQVVSFGDLDKLPVKLCFFSLFMELEFEMLRAMSWPIGNPTDYLPHLSKSRLQKAQELCAMKYAHETPEKILMCSTFIDKMNIFLSDDTLLKCLPFSSKTETNRFFSTVERMRNQVAHSDSILEIVREPTKLNTFISTLNNVIRAISSSNEERAP